MFAGEKLRTRCPKCRSRDFQTTEVFEELVHVRISGGIHPGEAVDHEPGTILGINCTCEKCGHRWVPRGATSMADLVEPRP